MKMPEGPMCRTPQKQKEYLKYLVNSDGCDFCQTASDIHATVIKDMPDFWIINARFPYQIWDGCTVVEHLLLVPKRHVTSVHELTDDEKKSYVDMIGEYEDKGYVVYSRSPRAHTKSMVHHHTHFIKLNATRVQTMVYHKKPHVLIYK